MADVAQPTKRHAVDKAKATTLGFVIGASVLTVFALVASKSFYGQASYLNKVAGQKEKALDQLNANNKAISTLQESYKSFSSQNPNLLGGNRDGTNERDGDNARLVLDALPSKYDFPALATSLEKLLTGYTINNISGSDDSVSQDQVAAASIVDMPFTLNVSSDYPGMEKLTKSFEKSIRPFQLLTVDFNGTNTLLTANFTAKTFYQPEKDLKISTKVIK